MAMLTMLLLGPPEVRHGGRAVTFATRKALALLAYLALEGAPQSREKLIAVFWPESDAERGRMALRRTLAYLREAIGDSAAPSADAHVLATRTTLGFSSDQVESDVHALETAWNQLRAASSAPSGPEAALRAQLQQAVARYRGDFLDGFSLGDAPAFDEWAAVQREQWHRRMGLVYERLAELQLAAGDYRGSEETAARWIAHYPLNEAAHRQLMQIHLAAGERPAALRAYEACRAVLEAELGAPPSAETEALAALARTGEVGTARQAAGASVGAPEGGRALAGSPAPPVVRPPTLPAPPNALIGREAEVAALVGALNEGARLLTLLGPPGIGKTRLAIQVAEQAAPLFAGEVVFVPLATLGAPELVAPAILAVLGLDDESATPNERLKAALRGRRLLLVLDNFEQILGAAGLVSELLAAAPLLAVLVTSRSPLQIYGEHERPVAPLALPDPARLPAPAELARIAAPQLFLERARAVRPDLTLGAESAAAVAAICARLDGLPLAIELAAARVRTFTPEALLERLSAPLAVLVDGPRDRSARQQTLRGAIAWSDALLSADEGLVFAQVGVFVGGWSLAAAEAVCAGDPSGAALVAPALARLLEASLVSSAPDPTGEPRFTMLQPIREYARERLAALGLGRAAGERHAAHYCALVESIEPQLKGPEQGALLARLEREHDNLRAALAWALADAELALALRLCAGLWWFWFVRGHLGEGRRWIAAALALDAAQGRPQQHARFRLASLNGGGVLAHDQGDYDQATALLEAGLELARSLEHERGIGAALNNLGLVARSRGDYPRAAAYYHASLASARARADSWAIAVALSNIGAVTAWQGLHAEAVPFLSESLALRRGMGDTRGIAMVLNSLADSLLYEGGAARAGELYAESLELQRQLDDRAGAGDALYGLGQVALARGAWAAALGHLRECLATREELGDRRGVAECLESGALLAFRLGDRDGAARLLGTAATLREAVGAPIPPLDQAAHEQLVAQVRAALGEQGFAVAWVVGQSLGRGQPAARQETLASLVTP
jgi:predicted ATPase/DNA-binding SARP family transcriptional activator